MALAWIGLAMMLVTRESPAQGPLAFSTNPPAAWAGQDPADSLYKAARNTLNDGNFRRASELFAQITARFPKSAYAGDALYWQAYALSRLGGSDNLEQAEEALAEQEENYPRAATRGDARALQQRIRGELAKLGDSTRAAEVARAATGAAKGACATDEDDEDDVRVAALNALLQMDAEMAMPVLRNVLARRDACSETLRKKAVFLVAQKRTADTEDVLMNVVRTDPASEVREQAVFWLSQVPGEKAITLLEEILKTSKDEEILDKAVFAVSQHNSERAGTILRNYADNAAANPDIREKAIFWLGQQRDPGNAAYLKGLFTRLKEEDLKEKVLFSISQRPRSEGNVSWLMDVALNANEDIEIRKKALFWAGEAGAPIAGLVALYDKMNDEEMKDQLIFVFSQRRDPAAVDKLLAIAKSETNKELQKKAIFWLSQSKDPRASKFLLDLINQ